MRVRVFSFYIVYFICLINEMVRYYKGNFKIFIFFVWNFFVFFKDRIVIVYQLGILKDSYSVFLIRGFFGIVYLCKYIYEIYMVFKEGSDIFKVFR